MIEKELREAVEKHLPEVTAGVLKDRLNLVDTLQEELRDTKESLADLLAFRDRVEDIADRENAVSDREQKQSQQALELDQKERDLALRQQLIGLREAHANERVTELRGVVSDVFRNRDVMYRGMLNSYRPDGASFNASIDPVTDAEKGKY